MAPRAKKARSTAEPASPAVSGDDLQKRLQMVKMIAMGKLGVAAPPAAAAASSSKPDAAPTAELSASASTTKPTPAATDKATPSTKRAPATRSKPAASNSPSTPIVVPLPPKKGKGKTAAPPAVVSSGPIPTDDASTPVVVASTSLKRPLPDAAEEEVDQLISSPPVPASPAVPKSVKNKLKKEKKQAKAAAKKEDNRKDREQEKEQEKEQEMEQVEAPAPAEPSSAIKQASEKAVKLPKRKALKAAAAASASTPAEPTPTASTSALDVEEVAAPPTPAQIKVKKALKRARSDSTSSSRPQSPARKASTTTAAAPKSASKSNKRRKLSPAPALPSSSQPIDPTVPPSLSSLYPTFLASLQRAHPTAFSAPHTGPMFDTIRKFLLELRGSGAEGDAALFEFFKALVRSGAAEGVESVWTRAKEAVGGEVVEVEEYKVERKRGKEERKRKRTEEKAARRAERKAAAKAEKQKKKEKKGAAEEEQEKEQEQVAPASMASKAKGKGKGKEIAPEPAPVDTLVTDAMEVDELATESDAQRQAREDAEAAERLAKKKAKKEKQEARKAEEKEQKRKEAEEKQKAAAAAEEEEPVIKISDSQLAAAAVPLPPSPVPASQPKPNGIVLNNDIKSSPSKERRFRTNRLGKKEKEELRSSRQSSIANGHESDAAVAPAETQSKKPVIVADEVAVPEPALVVEEGSSQPEPAMQEEEQVAAPAPAVAEPQVDAMEVDEPVAAPSPAQPEPEAEKMDDDFSPSTETHRLPNGDLSPEPEQSSLAAAPTAVISKPAIFARPDSLKSRYSVASSEEDPEELELSLREHCSPARKSTRLPSAPAESSSPSAPAPPSEDLYAPLPQRPEALKLKSPTKPEEVPLPPSRSASPEDEDERVVPPPLRRQDTIGGGDSDSDSSSSDDDSSDEQSSDEDFAPVNARPKVKRTSLSAVAAAAFGKPGTPRAKSNLGKVTSPRRNQSQLSQSTVRPADEEDEFDQLLSQSQPRKRLSIAHVLPQDDDEGKIVGGGDDDDDGASSNFSPVASSVEGTPRVAKKKALNGKQSRDSSEEPDTVDEDEEMATKVVSNSRVNGDDALGFISPKLSSTPRNLPDGHVDLPPSSAAMIPSFSSQSASQQYLPNYARLSAIGSAASSQVGDNSFELDELSQSPNLAQPTSEESQWQGLPQKDSPLFFEASQQESQALGQPGESQLKEVEHESMDPLDQTQVAFPVDGHGLPKGLSELMDQADTPQKIVVTAPTDDEAGLQTLHGASPSPAPSGRLTRSSAASRAATRSPSPGPAGPTKPRAAATAAAKRTTRGVSASAHSTPKVNGTALPTSSASQPTPTTRKATPKVPSASQPLPTTTRLGARSASQMKSLSQLDAISSTPKSAARTTRSRTAPVAPATAPAAAKWTKRNDESSDEEGESSSDEEMGAGTTTTRSGRKSVGVAKGRKSLW